MKKNSKLNKSKSKDKKDKNSDKKSKSSKSKKSSRSNSKEKISSKGTEKNIEESINPDISGINKEPGQNNNLDITYTQYFSNRNQINNINSNVLLQNGIPKCDGCFENDSVCFCKECKKSLCHMCDNQIHIIPANSNHLRVNLNDIIQMKKLCYHHQMNLEFFCESCDEAICKQCQIIGPHNTNYHRIIQINEAFSKKYYQLSKMKPILMNKLGELNYYNNKVNELTEKVNITKKELDRDIRTQYTALSEKVKDIEGKRNAILSFETSQLQCDNNNIQDINNYVMDVQSKKGPSMLSFILQFPQLKNKIERLLEKPLKEKIDLSNIENFPNDLEERHKILEDYDKIKKQLETKNDTIWAILNEKKQKEKSILDSAKKRSMEQIEEKAKLSDKYDKDLKKYMIVCSFCGKYIDKKTVNSDCQANEQFYLNFYFTKEAPPLSLINTKRHYFGEPVSNNLNELLTIAENMWDKQRNEIAMKMKEDEERMAQEHYMQNMENPNMNNSNNDMKNNNEQQRVNTHSNNDNYNDNNNLNSNIEYNINISKTENVTRQTNINNNQREIIKEDLGEMNPRKSHEFREKGNMIGMEAQNYEIRQKGNFGKDLVENILKSVEEKKIDLLNLLSNCDTDEDGFLEKNELKFGLNKINQLNPNEFETLLQYFNLNEKINIKDFINQINQESIDKLNHSSFSKKSVKIN
jgi:palmitoyltransferase